jgi:hypothetical protein
VPIASTSPWFIASTRSDTLETSVMSCSTISTVMPNSRRMSCNPVGHVVGLFDVQARGGFVQQQQACGSVHSARASSTTLRTP